MLERERTNEETSDIAGEDGRSRCPIGARVLNAKGSGLPLELIEGEPAGVMLFVLCREAKVELYSLDVTLFMGPETERAVDITDALLDGRLGPPETEDPPDTDRRLCNDGGVRNWVLGDLADKEPYPDAFLRPEVDESGKDERSERPAELITLGGRDFRPLRRS